MDNIIRNKCGCGKGYASEYDSMCKFCRETLVSRAIAKKYGVKHRGDGMSVTQYRYSQRDKLIKRVSDFDNLTDKE